MKFLENITAAYLSVRDVSPDQFKKIISPQHDGKDLGFRVSLYSAVTKILIITIPTVLHKKLHRYLDEEYFLQAVNMGLRNEFLSASSATFDYVDHTVCMETNGEGDSTRKPFSKSPADENFPTLVIEVGYAHTLQALRTKARWWFELSSYAVKIVLLAKLESAMRALPWRNGKPSKERRQHERARQLLGGSRPQPGNPAFNKPSR